MTIKEKIITVLDFMNEEQLSDIFVNLQRMYVLKQRQDIATNEELAIIKQWEESDQETISHNELLKDLGMIK